MDRNKEKRLISEIGGVGMTGERGRENLIEDAEGIPGTVLPFQGQQIWVYNQNGELKEPVLLSMIRSVRDGDGSVMQQWSGLRMIISEYKGIWSGLGIRYTTMLLRTKAKDDTFKVVRFRNTFLMLLKAG